MVIINSKMSCQTLSQIIIKLNNKLKSYFQKNFKKANNTCLDKNWRELNDKMSAHTINIVSYAVHQISKSVRWSQSTKVVIRLLEHHIFV